MRARLVVIAVAACSNRSAPPAAKAEPVKPPARDAGPPGITAIGTYDPASGAHLDDDTGAHRPTPAAVARPGRPIDIVLRSTPTGALAAVDGTPVGTTPTYWPGEADGREHEFTFVRKDFTVARYRFVPIGSGTVHATLEPILEETDAGVPELAPPADAFVAPPPPPTVVTPADAASPNKLPF